MNDVQRQNHRGDETPVAWSAGVLAARSEVRATGFEVEGRGIARWITREAAIAWAACGAFEWVALGYLAASSALIAVFAENLAHPVKLIGLQALVAAMILVLCRVEARVAERTDWGRDTFSVKFWHFWRHWYPHLFFLFCFEELGKLVHLVTPGWQDAKLIAADYWLAGIRRCGWNSLQRRRGTISCSSRISLTLRICWCWAESCTTGGTGAGTGR